MCELTYVHTGRHLRNKLIAYSLAFINGAKHKDGVGFSSGLSIWKTSIAANAVTNLFPAMNKYVSGNDPIIVHTRFASTGATGFKEITDENAHPFLGERYVFAHNGLLHPKIALTKEQKDAIGNMTDSEYFFHKFEVSKQKDAISALAETMKEFTGKFAFLLYDDKTKKRFAIRGSSASLHWIPLTDLDDEPIGFVINTEKEDLIRGLVLATNLCGGMNAFKFDTTKIVEFDKDTAYDISGPAPEKVGMVCENFPAATVWDSTTGTYRNGARTSPWVPRFPGADFARWCIDNFISPEEIDFICQIVFSMPVAALSSQELGLLDTWVKVELEKRTDKKKQSIMKSLMDLVVDDSNYLYGVEELPFPYMLADHNTLKNLERDLKTKGVL